MDVAISLNENTRKKFRIDPRTKILFLLSVNLMMSKGIKLWVEVTIVLSISLLLIIFKKYKVATIFTILFGILMLGEIFVLPYMHGVAAMIVSLIFIALRKFLPCIMTATMLVTTTKINEFIAAMQRMHVSDNIIIPFAVILRFFPTVKEEWNYIKKAMQMRGIGITIGKVLCSPIKTIEYILVPLLFSSIKIGEELSAAALSRGLGTPVKRTNICDVGFSIYDMLAFTYFLIFLILSFLYGRMIE